MFADNRKVTLQAIHTDAVNKAVNDQKKNIVLDDRIHSINDSGKKASYKSRIKKDASLNVCADCGKTPHDVKHRFAFPVHPTTLIPSDLWSRLIDSIYLEAGNLD